MFTVLTAFSMVSKGRLRLKEFDTVLVLDIIWVTSKPAFQAKHLADTNKNININKATNTKCNNVNNLNNKTNLLDNLDSHERPSWQILVLVLGPINRALLLRHSKTKTIRYTYAAVQSIHQSIQAAVTAELFTVELTLLIWCFIRLCRVTCVTEFFTDYVTVKSCELNFVLISVWTVVHNSRCSLCTSPSTVVSC